MDNNNDRRQYIDGEFSSSSDDDDGSTYAEVDDDDVATRTEQWSSEDEAETTHTPKKTPNVVIRNVEIKQSLENNKSNEGQVLDKLKPMVGVLSDFLINKMEDGDNAFISNCKNDDMSLTHQEKEKDEESAIIEDSEKMDDDDNDVVGIEQVGVEEMKNVVGVEKMILAGQDYDSDSIEDEEFLTTLLEAESFNDEEEKTAEEETFLEAGEFRSDLNLVDETSVPIDEQFQQQQQQYDDDDDSSEESEDEENTNNVLGTEENEKVYVSMGGDELLATLAKNYTDYDADSINDDNELTNANVNKVDEPITFPTSSYNMYMEEEDSSEDENGLEQSEDVSTNQCSLKLIDEVETAITDHGNGESLDILKQYAYSIQVKLLLEHTKHLHCQHLVKLAFGTGESSTSVVQPPIAIRNLVKRAISTELTVRKFTECASVTDVSSAKLIAEDIENLEKRYRHQILCNPILNSIDPNFSLCPKEEDEETVTTKENLVQFPFSDKLLKHVQSLSPMASASRVDRVTPL